ncbi:MAG: AAA family ATPase, partial [Myxococcales bacterium]|nr:AAA family ATPase [Myxococcales bacterium]
LLQVMDHATLTDNNGRRADFRHVVLIMTTNAGARDLTTASLGFARQFETAETKSKAEIERIFSPEFRNRLDAWVVFEQLKPDAMGRIVDKFVNELQAQLVEKRVEIELTSAARGWLADEGYDPLFGARPLARVIQDRLKKPLAEEILFGGLQKGGKVTVRLQKGQLQLDVHDGLVEA